MIRRFPMIKWMIIACVLSVSCVSRPTEAQVPPPCTPNSTGLCFDSDAAVMRLSLVSRNLITLANRVSLSGGPVVGETVGFDFSFTWSGVPFLKHYRHTFIAGDTLLTAALDLCSQIKADADVVAAIGQGNTTMGQQIINHCVPLSILGGSNVSVYFNGSRPFVVNGGPHLTAAPSPATAVSVADGGLPFDPDPIISCVRTTKDLGDTPQPLDAICIFVVPCDTTTTAASIFDDAPFCSQGVWRIVDPTPGVNAARVDWIEAYYGIWGGFQHGPADDFSVQQNQNPLGNAIVDTAARRIYTLTGLNISTWQTIATLTPSTLVVTSSATASCDMNAVMANGTAGSLHKLVHIALGGGTLATDQNWNGPGGDIWTAGSSSIRLIVSGATVQVQVQAGTAGQTIASGMLDCTFRLAGPAPLTWQIQ